MIIIIKMKQSKRKINTFKKFIKAFTAKKLGRMTVLNRHYKVLDDGKKLVYEGRGRNVDVGQDILILTLKDGRLLGNASKLDRCGSYRKGDEAPAQRVMFDMSIPMIPFNVFTEAKLNIETAKIIQKGKEEDFFLPKLEWSEKENMLMPVQIIFSDESKKEPFSDDNKIILKKYQRTVSRYKKNKKGDNVKDKKGNFITQKFKVWEYDYRDLKQMAKRHYVGAMLLQVGKKQFLFDVDRRELKYFRFNPFLAELPRNVKTIKEAYDVIMPEEVRLAIKKGLKVKRQGEWFYIPTVKKIEIPKIPKEIQNETDKEIDASEFDLTGFDNWVDGEQTVKISEIRKSSSFKDVKPKYRKEILSRLADYNRTIERRKKFEEKKEDFEKKFNHYKYGGELKAGDNRPNEAEEMLILDKINYVKGVISHTGREHEDMDLGQKWHKAVPNTATKSFTITGNID